MARGKKKQPTMELKFTGTGVKVTVTKVTAVTSENNFFHLDELPDGTWRICYNDLMIPDHKQLEGIKIVRNTEG